MGKRDRLVFCGDQPQFPEGVILHLGHRSEAGQCRIRGDPAEAFLQQLFRAPHGNRLSSHPAGKIGNQKHHQGMTHGRFLSMLRFPDSGFRGTFQFPSTRFSSEFFSQTIHHIEDIEELEHKLKQFLFKVLYRSLNDQCFTNFFQTFPSISRACISPWDFYRSR